MFRTSRVHHQAGNIVHAAFYGMFFMHLCNQPSRWKVVLDAACTNGLLGDEHVIFETCRRQQELNKNFNPLKTKRSLIYLNF